ncbi:MAG: protein translocase SEC61 complex subunit gamma [Thaumarchaeota archaeon]|nr:protein translocase SEC61 complex subunit gamma [Nitrososphaerota archaeon]
MTKSLSNIIYHSTKNKLAGIVAFINSCIHTLKLAKRSDRTEFLLYLKLTVIGMSIVGTIGYVIQLVGSLFRLTG